MKYVHPDYKTKEVIDYIDYAIVNAKIESISDLNLMQKGVLSGMLLKTENIHDVLNFISQNDHDEKFKDLLSKCMIKTGVYDQLDVLQNLAHWLIDYYEPMIESILNERLDDIATF